MRVRPISWAALAILVLLSVAYANHFDNGFHFDDSHAIVDNVFIRSLGYVPRYFVDATTFSVLPLNQTYRPALQTTFAIDYWMAGGYHPLAFHADTFAWYLLLLVWMFALFAAVAGNAWLALTATALFALHPVSAETVNYIVQRGDLLSTLGVVAGLAIYARWRPPDDSHVVRRGWWTAAYLVPFVFGSLAKPSALVFPALLVVYDWISSRRVRWRDVMPSLVVTVALGLWMARRTPPTLVTGAADPARYLLTQPLVALRYFASFFAPTDLSADNDWRLVSGPGDVRVLAGAAFVVATLWMVWRLRRSAVGKPIAFGLAWFVVALLPTSLTPLAEVANDHRMFFPFVGLSLSVTATGAWLIGRWVAPARRVTVATVLVAMALVAGAAGVRARNEVWRTDETLWRDVIVKSPGNGRGWMNYGVSLMNRGEFIGAIAAFDRAAPLTPNYSLLYVNRGVAFGSLGRQPDADQAFIKAIALAPSDWRSHTFYARWLASEGRLAEALAHAQIAAELNPSDPIGPALAAQTARAAGTPEYFVSRSLAEYQMARYRNSIASAERALAVRPDYAEALNNVAAGHIALGEWDAGIAAAEEAVRLNPQLKIAWNNLAFARQKARGAVR